MRNCILFVGTVLLLSGAMTAGAIPDVNVPDGGATALLLGLAVSGFALFKKRRG
jgi:hypothetical protein